MNIRMGRIFCALRKRFRIHASNGWAGSAFQSHSGKLHRTDAVKSFCRTAGVIFAGTLGCFSDFVRSGDSFNQSKCRKDNRLLKKWLARINGEPFLEGFIEKKKQSLYKFYHFCYINPIFIFYHCLYQRHPLKEPRQWRENRQLVIAALA